MYHLSQNLYKHVYQYDGARFINLFLYIFLVLFVFRDAVCLAKCRLPGTDPVIKDLIMSWSKHLANDFSYEQAAKW